MPSGLQKSNGDEFQNDAIFICIGNDDIHVVHRELPQGIHICTMAEKKKKYFFNIKFIMNLILINYYYLFIIILNENEIIILLIPRISFIFFILKSIELYAGF